MSHELSVIVRVASLPVVVEVAHHHPHPSHHFIPLERPPPAPLAECGPVLGVLVGPGAFMAHRHPPVALRDHEQRRVDP